MDSATQFAQATDINSLQKKTWCSQISCSNSLGATAPDEGHSPVQSGEVASEMDHYIYIYIALYGCILHILLQALAWKVRYIPPQSHTSSWSGAYGVCKTAEAIWAVAPTPLPCYPPSMCLGKWFQLVTRASLFNLRSMYMVHMVKSQEFSSSMVVVCHKSYILRVKFANFLAWPRTFFRTHQYKHVLPIFLFARCKIGHVLTLWKWLPSIFPPVIPPLGDTENFFTATFLLATGQWRVAGCLGFGRKISGDKHPQAWWKLRYPTCFCINIPNLEVLFWPRSICTFSLLVIMAK